MNTVTISSRFQVVIPKAIREELALEPGERVQAIAHDGRIELVRLRPMHEMRGFLGDIDTVVDRDDDRDTLATNRDEDGK